MSTKDIYPVGTRVYHIGHGFGTIINYNGSSEIDFDKQVEQFNEVAKDMRAQGASEQAMGVLNAGFSHAMIQGLYNGERYPYVIRYQPTEKYPEGFKEVYGQNEVWFEKNGKWYSHCEFKGDTIVEAKDDDEFKTKRQALVDAAYAKTE